ncbi:LPS O-antigen chain length determinant protein WzzB [Pasteurellaceae bacterium 22721_9_1]
MSEKVNNDEIDLLELIRMLWDKKWWIILSTFVCTALAAAYAFTAKEQWTSRTEIIKPSITDMGSYLALRKEYERIIDNQLDVNKLSDELYEKFGRFSLSLDERERMLVQTEVYKQLSEGKDTQAQRRILNILARENISISTPDPKKDPNAIGKRFGFSAETPELAQNTLKLFIEHINAKASQSQLHDFNVMVTQKIADLEFSLKKIEEELKNQKAAELEKLTVILDTMKKSDIKDLSPTLSSKTESNNSAEMVLDDDFKLFVLGEQYVNAKIDMEKAKPIVYPSEYLAIQTQLRALNGLAAKTKDANLNAFSYLSSPDYPVIKDKPKKALILLIGCIVGFILSSFLVLMVNFLRKK